MKNIHIISTDKPGRFSLKSNGEYCLSNYSYTDSPNFKNQNIYITSDEEIKEGEWHLHYYEGKPVISKSYNSVVKVINEIAEQFGYKKIILTTDQDLINDDVQAIDDEFLEWFVNNPSCESVDVKLIEQRSHLSLNDWVDKDENGNFPISIAGAFSYRKIYKINTPKKEFNYNLKDKIEWMSYNPQCKQIESCYNSLSKKCVCPKETQTLDKYIQKISNFVTDNKAKTNNTIDLNAYGLGAIDALKKSRMDEMFEMLKLLVDRLDENDLSDLSATKRAKQLINDLSL